jgi:hypothetical protein
MFMEAEAEAEAEAENAGAHSEMSEAFLTPQATSARARRDVGEGP